MSDVFAAFLYAACADIRTLDFALRAGITPREAFVLLCDAENALIDVLGLPR